MQTATLTVPEIQVIDWVLHLSPEGKQEVLRRLIPGMHAHDERVSRGIAQMQAITAGRGLKDWTLLSDEEQAALIDQLLHE